MKQNDHENNDEKANDISEKKQNILKMADYQQRISELLDLCQQEWVLLESLIKENKATPSINHAAKDLRDGIKRLVQLQDNLDEIGNIVENNSEWNKKADILMEEVRKRLQFASKLTSKVQPITSHSSPLRLSTTQTFKDKLKKSQDNIQEEEEEEDDEQFLDASEELPEHEFRQLDLTVEPTSSSDIIKTSRSTSSSISTSSIKSFDHKPFGRRSIIADDMITFSPSESMTTTTGTEKKKSLFPLLKMGLRTSQSTPIRKKDAPAQINFYKEDQRKDDTHFIFATDAIVDHPLRIGVGYGSYICYSCTIFSDKGAPITVRKRYSDFVDLREELLKEYPSYKKSIPKLPPKKVVGKFTPAFVEQRRRELEYFFKYIVLHPVIGSTTIVKHWIAP